MEKEVTVLIAEDDEGHHLLIRKNLEKAGISNRILHFKDGEEILNFLFRKGKGIHRKTGEAYILLLDIRMPKIDGIEVLKRVKKDKELKKLPVIIITTTDSPEEIELSHSLGCNNYITKPIDYNQFVKVIKQVGLFIKLIQIPPIGEKDYEVNGD